MLPAAQHLLLGFYAVLPAASIFLALKRRRGGHRGLLASVILSYLGGIALGTAYLMLNAQLTGGRIPAGEAVRLIYFAIAAVCLLKIADRFLLRQFHRLARVPVDAWGRPISPNRPRAVLSHIAQRAVMLAIAVPYFFGLMLSYRPKVLFDGCTPALLKLAYENASPVASDGTRLAGWWIPARPAPPKLDLETAEQWSRRSIILCHGLGGGKERQLGLAWLLASRGYNVLAFDFRGYGQSGGNFISYGDLERRDVLAAVKWIQANKPDSAERIFGIGANTGAAALLAAAGQCDAIDAVVLFEPYARFDALADHAAARLLPRGVRWIVRNLALPIASLHAGTNLSRFAPIDCASDLWPRPALVIHGRGETFIPASQEMDLYQALASPRQEFWPADNYLASQAKLRRLRLRQSDMLGQMFREYMGEPMTGDAGAQWHTLRFLREARRVPVI